MATAQEMKFRIDLHEPLVTQTLLGVLQQGDAEANVLKIAVYDGGWETPAELNGNEVSGYFLREDGERVLLDGSISGHVVTVVLNENCYAISGAYGAFVRLVDADTKGKRTILRIAGQVESEGDGPIIDPANRLPSIEDVFAQLEKMEEATEKAEQAANSVSGAAEQAQNAAGAANTAAYTANSAATNANNATARANTAAEALENAPVPIGTVVTYQAGTSATTPPTGTWLANPPAVSQGQYLWTRTVQSFTNGNPVTSYSVARQGMDGSGSVQSVNNVQPVEDGNITLTGANIPVSSTDARTTAGAIQQHDKTITTLTAAEFEALSTQELAALYASGVRTVLVEQTGEAGSDPVYLRVDVAMSLTNAQKATALTSIGAAGAIRNAADNSDFRHWVAQAGIGGNHGTQAYGGDRWILDSGTITGAGNANGTGYGSITLNGTIRQIIAEPQEAMTAFVGMISGTAEVAYTYAEGVGELTITSAGGVLDWVMLLPGAWESAPPYVPKGYGAESAERMRYFVNVGMARHLVTQATGGFELMLSLRSTMRVVPTGVLKTAPSWVRMANTHIALSGKPATISSIDGGTTTDELLIKFATSATITTNSVGYIDAARIDLIADL